MAVTLSSDAKQLIDRPNFAPRHAHARRLAECHSGVDRPRGRVYRHLYR